jgi:hypothetical protein
MRLNPTQAFLDYVLEGEGEDARTTQRAGGVRSAYWTQWREDRTTLVLQAVRCAKSWLWQPGG